MLKILILNICMRIFVISVLTLFTLTTALSYNMKEVMNIKMNQIIKIKTGTYFGECLGYCNEELLVSSECAQYTLTTNVKEETAPPISGPITIKGDIWNALAESLDPEAWRDLPKTIGCPDCTDNGGEWVEVQYKNTTKRVDFEFGASVSGLDGFIAKLRALREEGAKKYRPQ